jgi:hypothetical protein
VARWRGLTWEYFRTLEVDDQAAYIAEYEEQHKLDALAAETARKLAEARARRNRKHGKSRV